MAPTIIISSPAAGGFNEKAFLREIKEEEEEEESVHTLNQEIFNKPLLAPVEHVNLSSPPPPKDDDIKERLSLEQAYTNRVIDPHDSVSTEYRERTHLTSSQWYFDEYAGIYRQNAPGLWGFQSMPSLHQHTAIPAATHFKDTTEKSLSSQSSTLGKSLRPSRSTSLSTNNSQETQQLQEWPSPRTVEQVHQLKKQATATRDRRKQLNLCRTLMDAACRDETEHVTESPIPGTPPVNTRYRQQELQRIKKKDLMLDQVLVLEAQKTLKRLALGSGLAADGDAQFLLANCYGVGGLGLPLDRERAFSLYIHASKQNHIEASYRAGVCYETGIGTRKDYRRAMAFYRKAATQSHGASMYKLAIILLRGYCGQAINIKEALSWLQRAVTLANVHAMYALAMFQLSEEFAKHTIADSWYALELLHTSANLEYVPSQVKLGELYEVGGNGLAHADDALSIHWYTRAAEKGNADAALALSRWYLTGSIGILPQSDLEAYLWARKAASIPHASRWTVAKAYYLVGMYIEYSIGISDTSTTDNANVWLERSAALGHLGAMELL